MTRRTRNSALPAFSLIELMIAIMILGIGLVMVATVFPVGLDMTRETVQMSLSLDAAETAVRTLEIRMPRGKDLNGNGTPDPSVPFPIGLSPDGIKSDEDENADIVATESPYQTGRVFTEQTTWKGDDPGALNTSFILISQNLPVDYQARLASGNPSSALIPELPPLIVAPGGTPPTARIHLADRVFPPLSLGFKPTINPMSAGYVPTVDDWLPSPNTPPFANMYEQVAKQAAERRYSWTVIHRILPLNGGGSEFGATVVVTNRGDLSSQYARQADPVSNPGLLMFNLALPPSDTNYLPMLDTLMSPKPDATDSDSNGTPDNDTIFPQAWLVMLHRFNPAQGTVLCTAEVARLLTPGSYFFTAWKPDDAYLTANWAGTPNSSAAWPAPGSEAHVLSSTWDRQEIGKPANSQKLAIVQITRTNISGDIDNTRTTPNPDPPIPVWVFPPPVINSVSPGEFGPRSPIIPKPFHRKVTPS